MRENCAQSAHKLCANRMGSSREMCAHAPGASGPGPSLGGHAQRTPGDSNAQATDSDTCSAQRFRHSRSVTRIYASRRLGRMRPNGSNMRLPVTRICHDSDAPTRICRRESMASSESHRHPSHAAVRVTQPSESRSHPSHAAIRVTQPSESRSHPNGTSTRVTLYPSHHAGIRVVPATPCTARMIRSRPGASPAHACPTCPRPASHAATRLHVPIRQPRRTPSRPHPIEPARAVTSLVRTVVSHGQSISMTRRCHGWSCPQITCLVTHRTSPSPPPPLPPRTECMAVTAPTA